MPALMTFGHTVPVTDLFGTSGRELLAGFELPESWATTLATSLAMLDELDCANHADDPDELAASMPNPRWAQSPPWLTRGS